MTDMTANMYRVGDYVYFETSSTTPYQIRRIEELIKTPNGNVEAKVMCFFRRRDISGSLIVLADKHQSALEEEQEREAEQLSEKHKHQLKLRELFLSRQVETLPATHIRGKCSVTLLNETESLASYLNKEDAFFYTLVYDPHQKTLLADKGEIRVGQRYQAEVPTSTLAADESDTRDSSQLETLVYTPGHELSDKEIDQFLIVCRSIGTFARALDCSSSIKQPSLHMSAAAASRDITLLHAMQVLHQNNYDIGKAVCSLVPPNGPVLCRDEMEEWSASEANLFEEALEKYGKDFNDIRQDFLPWKSLKNLVEYYYMWKTTDRYVQQKRVKAVEAESKLKQVYIPNYNNKPNAINGGMNLSNDANGANGRPCESCGKQTSSQWYAYGPSHLQCRLCQSCWTYWKKFGGLKYSSRIDVDKLNSAARPPTDSQNALYPCRECNKVFNRQERLASHMASHRPHRCTITNCGKEFKFKAHLARHCATAHGLVMRSGSPRPIMKTRAAFYLCATLAARVARRLCSKILKSRHATRNPFSPINVNGIRQECQTIFANGIPPMPKTRPIERGKVVDISHKLGTPQMPCPEWLKSTPKDQLPQPERLAFPPPPRGEDGQLLLPPIVAPPAAAPEEPVAKNQWGINNVSQPIMLRKRTFEQNGSPVPLKRRQLAPPSILGKAVPDFYGMTNRNTIITPLNGRAKVATITRVGGRKQMISWVDAPDDVYFVANDQTRRLRRQLMPGELRRAARRPWRRCGKSLSVGQSLGSNTANNLTHSNSNANSNPLNISNSVQLFPNPVSIA